jgi:acylphosphatase
MAEKLLHKNITINGWVQGVGFRYACQKSANQTGIKGFVKNQIDGSVYIEAEGTTNQMELFLVWCRKGPVYANVDNISVKDGALKGFHQFEIFR